MKNARCLSLNTIIPLPYVQGAGLYASGPMLVTQCEPQGFRRIAFHLDRPDILTKYTVTVEGGAEQMPVLLSNGNLVGEGSHWRDCHSAAPPSVFSRCFFQ